MVLLNLVIHLDDKHEFTGSIEITGSLLTIDSVGGVSGSLTSTSSFGTLELTNVTGLPPSKLVLIYIRY